MAKSVQIKVNYSGVGEMLRSAEMKALLQERANEIQSRCGSGYEADTYNAGSRVIASVTTTDFDSMRDNAENNTILKALK